jgi:hypothetical protein
MVLTSDFSDLENFKNNKQNPKIYHVIFSSMLPLPIIFSRAGAAFYEIISFFHPVPTLSGSPVAEKDLCKCLEQLYRQ